MEQALLDALNARASEQGLSLADLVRRSLDLVAFPLIISAAPVAQGAKPVAQKIPEIPGVVRASELKPRLTFDCPRCGENHKVCRRCGPRHQTPNAINCSGCRFRL